ncbi:AtpZ/AtpI family protein [uncultured Maribacter sp.]|uniref:AtpZ/AtpI family protein n=1 Tax=uncultured Maribacter sp. TaxID=431308 RepID=UPI00261BE13C|nr:AtpZ/AtpI family protein [uncultured Maribacter sp.]
MEQQKHPKKNKNLKNFGILSGIAIEMGAIIFLAAKGGVWLDEYYQTDKKIFTAFSTIAGVAIALYLVLKQLKRIKY